MMISTFHQDRLAHFLSKWGQTLSRWGQTLRSARFKLGTDPEVRVAAMLAIFLMADGGIEAGFHPNRGISIRIHPFSYPLGAVLPHQASPGS